MHWTAVQRLYISIYDKNSKAIDKLWMFTNDSSSLNLFRDRNEKNRESHRMRQVQIVQSPNDYLLCVCVFVSFVFIVIFPLSIIIFE